MFALFSATDLQAEARGQFALDDLFGAAEAPAATVIELAVMPDTWELIPREAITGQGVLGA